MFVKVFNLVCAAFIVLLSNTCERVNASETIKEPSLDDLVRWVPRDMETLVVCDGPFGILGNRAHDSFANGDLKDLSDLPFEMDDEESELEGSKLRDAVSSKIIIHYIEGSRRFKPPEGNAGAEYDGVHLIHFQKSIRQSVSEFLQRNKATKTTISGLTVGAVSREWGSSRRDWFISVPIPNLLVVTTDKTVMAETLKRIFSPSTSDSIVQSFPACSKGLRCAKFFAMRHYQRESLDPKSEFCDPTVCPIDSKAVGFTMTSKSFRPSEVELIYFSHNSRGAKLLCQKVSEAWPELKAKVVSRRGIESRIAFDIKTPKQWFDFRYLLICLLGHVPYV